MNIKSYAKAFTVGQAENKSANKKLKEILKKRTFCNLPDLEQKTQTMKPLSKEEEVQGESPFTGFDKIYDTAIDHALDVVRRTYLRFDSSIYSAKLFVEIEKNLLELKSNKTNNQ